ncbi:nitrilase-related carbon-nitrogen hydrolase [Nocardia otitidiscaviarum]|uniref:nitrilase-related carbon-nitrogen hydrolase n=1 Tax=Nocardia otitidiscaviarum TaxID=1823 RepID=UPI0018952329|nr:nitrilase-related carbon-nitrogen hydrolase [Nocardia otitidiscaviarum]MBF6178003.1 nitrilase [Nocardia otitidiscaviarum]
MRQVAIAGVAALLSAVLWHVGSGLHPVPGVAFLAPLPVLLVAPSLSTPFAFLSGACAWLGGALWLWPYLTGTVEQPVPATVALLGGSALWFGALVALMSACLRRGRTWSAVIVVPAGWVALEFSLSLLGPFGAWWSIAYTQAEVLPVLQTAAVTGVWGLTFILLLAPSVLAVAANVDRPQRIRLTAMGGMLAVAVAGFGAWRLAAEPRGETVRAGLVAVSQPPAYVPVDSPAGQDMIARVIVEVESLADRGARVVVLPEKAWRADESTLSRLSGPLTEVAVRREIHIVAGLILTRAGRSVNAAIDFPSGAVYAKHHLVPGLEDDLAAGDDFRLVPGEPWALAVCFDLDRPALVRENRRLGATLLLVPALDFTDDHWLHSRMAVVRGVESGMGVARAAQLGELVVSDSRGRVLASARTDITTTASVLADVPLTAERTVYARFGDWFAWVGVGLFVLVLVDLSRRPRRRTEPT